MIEHKNYIIASFLVIAVLFVVKLMHLQLFDSNYSRAASSNSIVRIVEYPMRGMMLDRHGREIVRNRPVFDLMVIPRELKIPNNDTTALCEHFGVDLEYVRQTLQAAREYSLHKPSLFIKHLSMEDYARIQDRLVDYPGIYAAERTVRDYPHTSLANALGYVKEVDRNFLEKDTTGYYAQGDLIGKSGLERYYERYLRGTKGVSFAFKNVNGVIKGKVENGKFDTIPGVGKNLLTTVDLDIQQYAEKLMQNKRGAIVAIEPSTGEILVMLSYPSYDPNLLTGEGKASSKNYVMLVNHPDKPLFNRAIQAVYPPGSTFKTVMALVGMQDGTLDSATTFFPCDQSLVGCHGHPSPLNVFSSLQHSCNPFYVKALRRMLIRGKVRDEIQDTRIGLNDWNTHLKTFGLGTRLGVDLSYEKGGLIPSTDYYDKYYYLKNWKYSNIYSIGIGQGEVMTTPLQLANMAATIANRGWYIAPHMVRQIGDSTLIFPKHQTSVDKAYFDYVARAMSNIHTAARAKIKDITVCGKTGTAQNPHGEDHSVFMAFAPLDKPKIAIAVYVENAGFGGTWAAPIASLIIERYIRGEISEERKWLEEYALSGNFMDLH